MSPARSMRSARALGVVGLSAALAVLAATSVATTTAAWSDPVVFTAQASVGTWPTPSTLGSCTVLTAGGTPAPGTTCTVTRARLIEQGGADAGELLRQYDVTFTTRTLAPDEQITFDVDLSSPEVVIAVATPNAAWTWDDASTVASPSVNVTPRPGYTCAELPSFAGTIPQGSAGPAEITVYDHRVAQETCD